MLLWLGLAAVSGLMVFRKAKITEQQTQIKVVFDSPIHDLDRFEAWLDTKKILSEDATWDKDTNITKSMWQETKATAWGGFAPKVEVEYDSVNNYILNVSVFYTRAKGNLTTSDLRLRVIDELRDWRVIADDVGDEDMDEED